MTKIWARAACCGSAGLDRPAYLAIDSPRDGLRRYRVGMATKLEGNEHRVFDCLINEEQNERFEDICLELTQSPPLSSEDVADALKSLQGRGYAEEFKSGSWKWTQNGYNVRFSLLGGRSEDGGADGFA